MTREAICAGLLFCETRFASRLARWRSIPPAGTSDSARRRPRDPAARKLRGKRRHRHLDLVHRRARGERRAEPRHFVGDLQRVAGLRPFVEHRGGEVGEPRLSGGLSPLPLANTRLAETTGSSLRSLRMTFRPLGSVNCSGIGNCAALTGPGFGMSFRQGSSALTLWAPPAAVSRPPAVRRPASSRPGAANSTTRSVGCRYCAAKALSACAWRSR